MCRACCDMAPLGTGRLHPPPPLPDRQAVIAQDIVFWRSRIIWFVTRCVAARRMRINSTPIPTLRHFACSVCAARLMLLYAFSPGRYISLFRYHLLFAHTKRLARYPLLSRGADSRGLPVLHLLSSSNLMAVNTNMAIGGAGLALPPVLHAPSASVYAIFASLPPPAAYLRASTCRLCDTLRASSRTPHAPHAALHGLASRYGCAHQLPAASPSTSAPVFRTVRHRADVWNINAGRRCNRRIDACRLRLSMIFNRALGRWRHSSVRSNSQGGRAVSCAAR